jgi:hypothetical protein
VTHFIVNITAIWIDLVASVPNYDTDTSKMPTFFVHTH